MMTKFYFWVNYPFKGIKLSLHEKKIVSYPILTFSIGSLNMILRENLAMSLSVTHFIFYFYSKKHYFWINSGLRIPGIR